MPTELPLTYVISAFVLIGIAFVFSVRWRRHSIDTHYGITMSGGRAGSLAYRNADQQAEVGWEMLVGEFDFVVYAADLVWHLPTSRAFSPAERQTFFTVLRDWAAAHRYKYQLHPDDADTNSTVG